jgi:hypothetical protein
MTKVKENTLQHTGDIFAEFTSPLLCNRFILVVLAEIY